MSAERRSVEEYAVGLMCGIGLLLAGVAGTLVSLLDPPSDVVERLMAGAVGLMGLVFGVAFLVWLLPARWGAGRFLLRHLGWLPGAALLPTAGGFIFFADDAAANSDRISSPAGSVVYGLGVGFLGLMLLWYWVQERFPRTSRRRRR